MGGKGSRKRKGGGVPTPGFGAGGPGGRFGGLLSPSPTPSVAGWETDEGGVEMGVSREAVAKVPRLGASYSIILGASKQVHNRITCDSFR